MNFFLTGVPERTKQPRDYGLTMMMDKGLSFNQAREFIEMNSEYTDIIKLNFEKSFAVN